MTSPTPEHYPITGICIVADPTKCPAGYECIYVSKDRRDDCDLWKDGLFRRRVTRYICFSRAYPSDTDSVLADVVINNEREPPPSGFTLIDFTLDTREEATRKKQICIRMLPRHSTHDAISDLVLLSRSKRAPPEYTLAGEMNGLAVCFKMSPVPVETQRLPSDQVQPQRPAPPVPPHPTYQYNNSNQAAPADTTYTVNNHRVLISQDSLVMPSAALTGVPFQLNARFKDMDGLSQLSFPEIHYRSLNDIENEYSYPFRIEQTPLCQIPDSVEPLIDI